MGHKIFVSYKYNDKNVKKITGNPYVEDTVRDYVNALEGYIENSEHIYKGEEDDEDLSSLTDDKIWEKLKDRIYDSTLTIIMISPNMKTYGRDRNQWIPWEVSYSLKEVSRKNKAGNMVTSSANALLAIVLPDKYGSYSYYIQDNECCESKCRTLKTNTLFHILQENMFNIKNPDCRICGVNSKIFHGESSYIYSVKWKDFVKEPEDYINKAYAIQSALEKYDISVEID